ncbi:MAG: amidase, partial [Alphaproteobacteria bacterium]
TKGMANPRGSFLNALTPSEFDAPVVARLRESGAVILGKTTMPELSVIPVTTSIAFGATLNPWDLSRSPGGSSGGAAAALAAGLCTLAVGTDGGGSIRLPASFTGLFGLKPTLGRVPYWPGQTDRTVAGPIARTAADAGLMMNIIARPDGRDWMELPPDETDYRAAAERPVTGLRVGFSRDFGFAKVAPDIAAATARAVARLGEGGCVVEEIGSVGFDAFEIYMIQAALRLASMRGNLDSKALVRFPRAVHSVLDFAERIGTADVQRMLDGRNKMGDALLTLFRRFDVIVSPTSPVDAPPLGLYYPDDEIDSEGSRNLLAFACPFNLVHMPAISAFCGISDRGLPIGLQIAGPKFSDATLLALGAQVAAG